MRPVTLEVTGFGTFRDNTVVAFEDSNYFVLVGPTGSGKSTVIDAICFALYGSVPRYENENLVAPVISQGGLEARVRLDFTVGERLFTAVRVVRRSGKGATTKEARLESHGEVLAGTADEVSEEIKRLIGLSFSQFTRCVVLPQGEFARFLHDKPASRQDLLVRLLNLDVYERMRYAASLRATDAKSRIAVIEQRLAEDLAFATEDVLKDAIGRAARVEKLRTRVAKAAPALKDLESQLAEAQKRLRETERALTSIDDLQMPDEVAELAEAIKETKAAVALAQKEVDRARKEVEAATKKRSALPAREPLIAAADAHKRSAALANVISEAEASLKNAAAERESALEGLKQAEAELAEAIAARRA
ncbi:MAG TPA: SMC family ATPase, partial [Actinomycetota bacterium]|nr:SMC family ATPase [Actinomycetota bacterium]